MRRASLDACCTLSAFALSAVSFGNMRVYPDRSVCSPHKVTFAAFAAIFEQLLLRLRRRLRVVHVSVRSKLCCVLSWL